jgi:hypothetical protein
MTKTRMWACKRRLRIFPQLIGILFILLSGNSWAELRLGAAVGLGGAGITSLETVTSTDGTTSEATNVSRSESPGALGFLIEKQFSEHIIGSIDHFRGFRLGPFSTGVSFTGLTVRWYFRDPPPSVPSAGEGERKTVHLFKSFSPSVALSSGLGTGSIKRDNDQVPVVSGSGIYMGIALGGDYQLDRGVIWRPEIRSYTTIASSALKPTTLKFFSLNCTFLFIW